MDAIVARTLFQDAICIEGGFLAATQARHVWTDA